MHASKTVLSRAAYSVFLLCSMTLASATTWAGPPFVTDDPEPVEYRNGEFYVSGAYANNRDGKEGAAPLFEFNYGIVPELQLHLLLPLAYSHPTGGPTTYGVGDLELGAKYRFIQESDTLPQVGTFPLVRLPTGDSDRDLGGGHVPVFLPVWLQKSWGPWVTYGGGGYWINPGGENLNFWQLGWLGEREITKYLVLGAEIFYFGKDATDARDRTGYTIGGIVNVTEQHHILFSAGSDIAGDNRFTTYLGYQWTFGAGGKEPQERKSTP